MPIPMTGASLSNRIVVVEGDITRQQVDAVVNTANTSLFRGWDELGLWLEVTLL